MQLADLISLMKQKNATQLVLSSAAPVTLLSYGQWMDEGGSTPSLATLNSFLQNAAPPHLKNEFSKSSGAVEWDYFDSSGKYKIQTQIHSGTRTITITQQLAARGSTPLSPHAARQVSDAKAASTQTASTQTGSALPPPLPAQNGTPSTPPPLPPTLSSPRGPHSAPPVDFEQRARDWKPPTAGEERAQKMVVGSAVGFVAFIVLSVIVFFVVFSQNSKKDYSNEFAVEVAEKYSKEFDSELTRVELEKEDWRHYKGKGKLADGENAELAIEIQTRDSLNRPDKWSWTVAPFNYSGLLNAQIKVQANENYEARESWIRLKSVSLTRLTRNNYSGTVKFSDDDLGDISVEILTFDAEGVPASWNYSISPR